MAEHHDEARILATLQSVFGYGSFRPLQQEIVSAVLSGQDVFVLMPTGGGKSLCYQLPALLMEGLTVVVSPLIALMKDQVDALMALGLPATFINSSLDQSEIGRRQSAVMRREVKLLYVAPERLMQPSFLHLLNATGVSLIAIDEAHCISEWGHDFRPEYRQFRLLRQVFPRAVLGAFTATATERVQVDIKTQLELQQGLSFRGSFNRSNLFYDVRPKPKAYEQLVAYLREHRRSSGIIYCHTRDGTERLAQKLRRDGFRAAAYHAGLEADERRRRQEAFVRDDVPIVVATVAFGMGIDKPDVRYVVHYDLPKTLEGYYQESGRAGRDGAPSDCIVFFSYGDATKYRSLIEAKSSPDERRIAQAQLKQMVNWAANLTCRRRALLAYFGERLDAESARCCDVCLLPRQIVDCTIPAQMFLSCVKRTNEAFGSAHLIDVLRGSRGERLLRYGHDKLSTYGIGRDRPKEEWAGLVHELLAGDYIRLSEDGFNTVKITERGLKVLFKGEQLLISQVVASALPASSSRDDDELFGRLRALRKQLADERGVAPYVIFHDSTLLQMVAELPKDVVQLRRISGIGDRKVQDFGDAILSCIAGYLRETSASPEKPALTSAPTTELPDTVQRTLDMFREGRGIAEIAIARELALSTVEGHMIAAIEAGEAVNLERLVCANKRTSIEAAMARVGAHSLRPIRDALGEDYTWAELKFVRALSRRAGAC